MLCYNENVVLQLSNKYQAELDRAIKLSEENSGVKKEREALALKVQDLESDVMRVELQLQTNHVSAKSVQLFLWDKRFADKPLVLKTERQMW